MQPDSKCPVVSAKLREDTGQHAQVAESVDALVSNTNVFGRAGSTPALGTKKPDNQLIIRLFKLMIRESLFKLLSLKNEAHCNQDYLPRSP